MEDMRPTRAQIAEMIEDNQQPYCRICGRNLNNFDTHIECMSRVPMVNHGATRKRKHAELLKLLQEATS